MDSQPQPATSDTIRLDDPEAIWVRIANAGVRTRPDFAHPEQWVACVMHHQTAAFPTREEAVSAAILWLVSSLQAERQRREDRESTDWLRGLFG
ncbi:hypothetical protein F8S13_20905 [Chloroflexia bacterium SDU3-3]|nr:hypothetical protein F8S13_20905 [Chloroflexia bacterium SDU3-3]